MHIYLKQLICVKDAPVITISLKWPNRNFTNVVISSPVPVLKANTVKLAHVGDHLSQTAIFMDPNNQNTVKPVPFKGHLSYEASFSFLVNP